MVFSKASGECGGHPKNQTANTRPTKSAPALWPPVHRGRHPTMIFSQLRKNGFLAATLDCGTAVLERAPAPLRRACYRAYKINPWHPWNSEHQAIFIGVPKTAGNAVKTILGCPGGWHATIDHYAAFDPAGTAAFFTFAFVRNPWDRLVSSFHYTRGHQTPQAEAWARRWLGPYADFQAFLTGLTRNRSLRKTVLGYPMFRPQSRFVCVEDTLPLSYIGRFEHLDEDLTHICSVLGLTWQKPPRVNTSPRGDYRDYYLTDRQIDFVASLYAADVARFGFRFDSTATLNVGALKPLRGSDPSAS